jgi:hypothetical protein
VLLRRLSATRRFTDAPLAYCLTFVSPAISLARIVLDRLHPAAASKHLQKMNFANRLIKAAQATVLRSAHLNYVPTGQLPVLLWMLQHSVSLPLIMITIGYPLQLMPDLVSHLLMLSLASAHNGRYCSSRPVPLNEHMASNLGAAVDHQEFGKFFHRVIGLAGDADSLPQPAFDNIHRARTVVPAAHFTFGGSPFGMGASWRDLITPPAFSWGVGKDRAAASAPECQRPEWECGAIITHVQVLTSTILYAGAILQDIFRRREYLRGQLPALEPHVAAKALRWPLSDPRGVARCVDVAVLFLWGSAVVWQVFMLSYSP